MCSERRPSVIVFGASSLGRRVLAEWPLGVPPVSRVVDNDPARWGTIIGGVPVESPEVLRSADPRSLVIVVASAYYEAIAEQLRGMAFIEGQHFVPFGGMSAHRAFQRQASRALRPKESDPLLVLWLDWFDMQWTTFDALCREADLRLVFGFVPQDGARADMEPTRTDYTMLRRHGVPLFRASVYDICVQLGVPIERLDPGDERHWRTIVEHMRHAAAIVDVAAAGLDHVQPVAVVIPQGHTKMAAIYRYLSVLRGLRVIALENTLNRQRLMWDDVAGIAVNKVVARNYFWRWVDLVDADEAAAHVRWYLRSIKQLKGVQHESPARAWPRPPAAGPTVLFLANVLTDSSVMFNSRVGSQIDAIRETARQSLERGCTFVLKVHPRERPGHDATFEGLTLRALHEDVDLRQMSSAGDRFIIDADNRFDTYDLIRKSDVCVTTCSQAGLEALLMEREVVVLGDAYYGGLGFTHDVQDRSQVGGALDAALASESRRRDADRVARFFYVLDRIYCVERSEKGLLDVVLRSIGRAALAVAPAGAGRHSVAHVA